MKHGTKILVIVAAALLVVYIIIRIQQKNNPAPTFASNLLASLKTQLGIK